MWWNSVLRCSRWYKGSVLVAALLLVLMADIPQAQGQGQILSHEAVEEERPASALAPLRPQSRPRAPTAFVAPALPRKTPAVPPSQPPMRAPAQATAQEDLLAHMDVYSLSPHAALLALPRMVTPQLAMRLRQGSVPAPQWEKLIAEAAAATGLPPALIAAVIRTESNFDPAAVSHKGAQGLMQLMPATQRHMGVEDPFDPRANVLAGSRYLRLQLERFGSLELALAAYNAGPENVARYGGVPPFEETRTFVQRVCQRMEAAQR